MPKASAVMRAANEMARRIVGNQTKVRLAMGFDAAIIAANRVFHMGPKRAREFANAYNEALEMLAGIYIDDVDENNDKHMDYAKGKRDQIILKIVGEENFQPFDSTYGYAYMDELGRIRLMKKVGEA